MTVRRRALVAAGLVVVSLNLRIAIGAVSPVLHQIQRSDGLSSAGGGLLTTVPVVCFGVFAFVTPRLIGRFGVDRLLWLTLAGLTAGIVARLPAGTVPLFAGTAVLGASIGVANVLLPGIIKRDFPDRVALMTGLYAMALSAGAALSAGLTVPIEQASGTGWRPAVAAWALPAAAALALWTAAGRRPRDDPDPPAAGGPVAGLRRDPLAWAVTGFMGLQSLSFYAALAWVPTVLTDAGMSAGAAGAMLSLSGGVAIAASLAAPLTAPRLRRPWVAVAATVGSCAAGFAGLAADPAALAWLWMVLLGVGQGAAISLALGYIVQRSPDTRHAAGLSTMAQGTGYLLAATGPFGIGAVHDLTGGWALPLVLLIVLLVPELVAGTVACRDRQVGTPARA